MAKRHRKKSRKIQVSSEARTSANARLKKRWARSGTGTPPERLEKLFAKGTKLPRQDKTADKIRAAEERAKASKERRDASSTSPGKAKPVAHGKPRGTGGRMTRGS